MPKFKVLVQRTEIYTDYAEIEANSESEAINKANRVLEYEGWDGLFHGEDGDYDECWSEAITACTEEHLKGKG